MKKELWVKGLDPDGNEVIMRVDGELLEKIQETMMPPAVSIMENSNESASFVDMGLYECDILPLKTPRIIELELDNE